ncbi:orotidine 5'-phosphate decarboxylase / HUMPS family protein [Sinosporangium album]|uniref:orotidine 5'-phosphate decarboxylase / HUMPS family protein n=1 Tax=Sinosporangium album TaxID=504805 RepID=UPI001C40A74E|nr:orotidine 5'-phosphate decarboxylase / HUMPS family protein [Sinosporangium album]
MARREDFRRLRGQYAVQIALDLHDLDHALHVAEALATVGVDFIEVGDPLIKQVGVHAVERVKQVVGATRVVAEMMSADWGRDQVEQAAEAGADVVLLIGSATVASVSAAVEAGRRLGTPILLDVPPLHASQQWVRDMERAGVDGFTITSNIDIGIGVSHPLARARAVRSWSRLPVAVSGGFSTTDLPVIVSQDWDILIVGRSITEAVRPRSAAEQLLKIVRTQRKGRDSAYHRP